ncbi:pentapeptide repeat-containing protein [Chloroflexi bacterium TSY]|nr:pentapeptide repeat-containing protein [Chloroflexi bacterium TSY]
MNELMLVLLLILMVFTLWYWLWRLAQYLWRPVSEWTNSYRIPIWQPRHPRVVIIAALVGLAGVIVGLQDSNAFASPVWRFLVDLAPEMVGLAFTVVVIDELVQRAVKQEELQVEKERIFEQLHSPVRDVAVEALRLVRKNGWFGEIEKIRLAGVHWSGADLEGENLAGANLRDAQLEGAKLIGANLEGADIWGARLAGADLMGANLKGTQLMGANLERTNLAYANLETADLNNANLERTVLECATLQEANLREARLGPDLWGVKLEGADLSKANLERADFEYVNLTGAMYTAETTWPDGFDPKAAGGIEVDPATGELLDTQEEK